MNEEKTKVVRKNGPRFNVIDAVILVLVLAAIVGIAIRYNLIGEIGINRGMEDYELHFSVSDIRYTSSDAFVEGDTVSLTTNGAHIGTMADLTSILPASAYAVDASGNVIQIHYPESTRIDVTGRILCRGTASSAGILTESGVNIVPGTTLAISTEHLDVTITVTSVQESFGS